MPIILLMDNVFEGERIMCNTINKAVLFATGKALPAAAVFVWQTAFVVRANDVEGVLIFREEALNDAAYRAGIDSYGVEV